MTEHHDAPLRNKKGQRTLALRTWRARQDLNPRPPWFVGETNQFVVLENQRLAALANLLSSLIKAQSGHTQSELVMQDDNMLTGKDAEEYFWREYKRHNEERAKQLADAKAA